MIDTTTTTSNVQVSSSNETDINIMNDTENNFTMHHYEGNIENDMFDMTCLSMLEKQLVLNDKKIDIVKQNKFLLSKNAENIIQHFQERFGTHSMKYKNGTQVTAKIVSVSASATSTNDNTIDHQTKKRKKLHKTDSDCDGTGRKIQNDRCNWTIMRGNSDI